MKHNAGSTLTTGSKPVSPDQFDLVVRTDGRMDDIGTGKVVLGTALFVPSGVRFRKPEQKIGTVVYGRLSAHHPTVRCNQQPGREARNSPKQTLQGCGCPGRTAYHQGGLRPRLQLSFLPRNQSLRFGHIPIRAIGLCGPMDQARIVGLGIFGGLCTGIRRGTLPTGRTGRRRNGCGYR